LRVAVDAQLLAAKPVLLYYGLMNLAKAFIITKGIRIAVTEVFHGLVTQHGPHGHEFVQAALTIKRNTGTNINVYEDFAAALGGTLPATLTSYRVMQLLGQDLLGNQLHSVATGDVPRFFKLESVQFIHDLGNRHIWLRAHTYFDERRTQGNLSVAELLMRTGLSPDWHQVVPTRTAAGRRLDCVELIQPIPYVGRPSDEVARLVEAIKPLLWTIALSDYPFRQYYLFADSSPGRTVAAPQLLSVYALMFYFGSVTRYRPNLFRSILNDKHGAQVEEFLSNQTSQFLYLLASEFQEQEAAQGALL
jgi:hypothetical protein